MSTAKILIGNCIESLKTLPDESVQCCVTSPPYWGLRDYGVDGQLGLEDTPQAFVANLVEVFREVRRVLRSDGTCFVNLGDSFASSVPNLPDVIHGLLKSGALFFGSTDPRRRAAERVHVLLQNELSPNSVFVPLLTAKRIGVKHGENHLCEIGGRLDAPIACWTSGASSLSAPHDAAQLTMNQGKYARIIITTTDLSADSPFGILPSLAVKYGKASFSVKVAGKPPPEGVAAGIPAFDSFTLNSLPVSIPDVNGVDEPVSLLDRPDLSACATSHFSVRKASKKEISFAFHNGGDLCFAAVSHLNLLSGSIVPYCTVEEQAQSTVNEMKPKQEVGIPEMVKRAMMKDGWICRQTIIWQKPNPMPESVRDRCTKAHEYIFLLTKSARYYWDQDAIREEYSGPTYKGSDNGAIANGDRADKGKTCGMSNPLGRNARSVWTITTKPYSGAHFATFPPELPMKCIKAGTSKKGCCPQCGAPRVRVVERGSPDRKATRGQQKWTNETGQRDSSGGMPIRDTKTTGWEPGCDCSGLNPFDPVPCTVLDPFLGSGTTAAVALKLGRNAIGCELNPEYAQLALKRCKDAAGMFGSVEIVGEQ